VTPVLSWPPGRYEESARVAIDDGIARAGGERRTQHNREQAGLVRNLVALLPFVTLSASGGWGGMHLRPAVMGKNHPRSEA